ncbi:MAG: DinB family protein [Gemmatimonadaceae bacterium]
MNPTIEFDELLRYEREQLDHWKAFFAKAPEGLEVPFAADADGGGRMATVRHVIHHIAGVECRYVDRLERIAVTPFEAIPLAPAGALFDAARAANARLATWVGRASQADLSCEIEFQTISAGTVRASARKIVAHTLLHGVRTWAQLATVLRTHGAPTDWYHDALFSEAFR